MLTTSFFPTFPLLFLRVEALLIWKGLRGGNDLREDGGVASLQTLGGTSLALFMFFASAKTYSLSVKTGTSDGRGVQSSGGRDDLSQKLGLQWTWIRGLDEMSRMCTVQFFIRTVFVAAGAHFSSMCGYFFIAPRCFNKKPAKNIPSFQTFHSPIIDIPAYHAQTPRNGRNPPLLSQTADSFACLAANRLRNWTNPFVARKHWT